jgi:hypothetical protein
LARVQLRARQHVYGELHFLAKTKMSITRREREVPDCNVVRWNLKRVFSVTVVVGEIIEPKLRAAWGKTRTPVDSGMGHEIRSQQEYCA